MADAAGERRDTLAERLFGATIEALELLSVYLGVRLGLYETLAKEGSLTPDDLAVRAGIHPRYSREWLEQQAAAGFLELEPGGNGEGSRRFRLPAGYEEVLADPESAAYLAPFSLMIAGIGEVLPEVVDAYRTGGGVPFARYGADLRDGQAAINRPAFLHDLASAWLSAAPDLHARLLAEPPARVADVGCGAGWSTIALAQGFPTARVEGLDLDDASIADARRNAAGAGVGDGVSFEVRDAADPSLAGSYDLVCVFEALHDMARPVEALAAMRSMLAEGGSVLVVDERVADEFRPPGDPVERMMYGWSVLHCLPASMAEQPSAATGTVMRTATVRQYAAEAGLADVEILPVENDLFRFYRLRPGAPAHG